MHLYHNKEKQIILELSAFNDKNENWNIVDYKEK